MDAFEYKQDNHLIVVLQCDECGDPRAGCRDVHCALRSRPYAGEDVVPVDQQRGAVSVTDEMIDRAAAAIDEALRYYDFPGRAGRQAAEYAIRAALGVPDGQ